MHIKKTDVGVDINFDCPLCGHNLDVDARGMGLEVPCPECGGTIVIPELPIEEEEESGEGMAVEPEREAPKLSNLSHYGDKFRCAYCRQYIPVGMVVCPLCRYDHEKKKRVPRNMKRTIRLSVPWGLVVSCGLLLAFVYLLFFSPYRPELPRTRALLERAYEAMRPGGDLPSEETEP